MTRYSSAPVRHRRSGRGRFRSRGLSVLTAVMVLPVMMACAPAYTDWTPAASPKENTVHLAHMVHDVSAGVEENAISDSEIIDLTAFLNRQQVSFGDRLYLVPANDSGALGRTAEKVRRHLRGAGLKVQILPGAEWAGAVPEKTVRLVVHRFVVRGPDCPDWRKPATGDWGNSPGSNFNCANSRNLGLMVADPRDLKAGRGGTPPDGTRSAAAVERYRKGEEYPLEVVDTGQ